MQNKSRLNIALLLMRISIFAVMLVWTLDNFIRPAHAASVYKDFYLIGGMGDVVMYVIGAVELVVILLFLLGMMKRFTYGAVLVLHAISTLSSFQQYLSPYEGPNILFYAAWPMLAACIALYALRDEDTLMTVGREGRNQKPGAA